MTAAAAALVLEPSGAMEAGRLLARTIAAASRLTENAMGARLLRVYLGWRYFLRKFVVDLRCTAVLAAVITNTCCAPCCFQARGGPRGRCGTIDACADGGGTAASIR